MALVELWYRKIPRYKLGSQQVTTLHTAGSRGRGGGNKLYSPFLSLWMLLRSGDC
jgi:hypothetical protein